MAVALRYGRKLWRPLTRLLDHGEVETAKPNGVEPQAWLADLLARFGEGWPTANIDDLIPWNWQINTVLAKPHSRGRQATFTYVSRSPTRRISRGASGYTWLIQTSFA